MNNLFSYAFLFILVLGIFLSFVSFSQNLNYTDFDIDENDIFTSSHGFTWPLPNIYSISSYFGPRNSPTKYASSYHYGLDIPASENTYFLASISGTITYAGFNGSGGYTIILENDNIKILYCHVSPNFMVDIRGQCCTKSGYRTNWSFSCL